MPFKKGKSGNKQGRKKGTPNKTTKLQREFIQSLLDTQTNKIKLELSRLHGKNYFAALNGLMEFVIPKLQRTEIKEDGVNDDKGIVLLGYGPEEYDEVMQKITISLPPDMDIDFPSNTEGDE